MSAPPWFLAIAAPNTELVVAERLERRGFERHVFRIPVQRVKRGRLIAVERAAFPRYIFVRIPAERWVEFFEQTEGISGYVRNGDGGPAHIPDIVITELVARAPNGLLAQPEAPCPFHHSERIIVRGHGLPAGYEARFEHALPGGRAIVLQEWLGRWVPIEVALNDLDHLIRRRSRHHRPNRRRGGQAPVALPLR
jgi:transcription antitermination factor NusG